MKKLLFVLFVLTTATAYSQSEKKITILFTNDLHSRLTGYAPESLYTPSVKNDDPTVGGFARIASIFRQEKQDDGITIIADAGDFLMGTLFQGLEPGSGFQLRLMKLMGYDAVAVGNHEFDFGPASLARIIQSARTNGEIPPVLLSNALFSGSDPADDSLKMLFDNNVISRKLILEKEGVRIGFFSLLGRVADENAAFAPPVEFENQVKVAKRMVKELEKDNCGLIICLSHSGVNMKDGKWTGEDVDLAGKVKGIDVIISGHTHTLLKEPILVNGVPVVQSGEYGKHVGKLELAYNEGNVRVNSYKLIPVDDRIQGDAEVTRLIEGQKLLLDNMVLKPLSLTYNSPVAETSFGLVCNEQGDFMNSNLGPMIADAIRSYVNRHTSSGTTVSLVAVGVIRDNILPGVQTAPDIFRLMSMGAGNDIVPGYPLAKVYVTGKELKNVLEILMVAYKSAPENYCFNSGISITSDPSKGMLKKISRIETTGSDGNRYDISFSKKDTKLYSITANSYMLEFVGMIKKLTFGLVNVVPKDQYGKPLKDMKAAVIDIAEDKPGVQEGKEWLALIEFLRSMKDTDGDGIAEIDARYSPK